MRTHHLRAGVTRATFVEPHTTLYRASLGGGAVKDEGFAKKGRGKGSSTSANSPHIVLVTLDDMGWNDIGYHSTDLPEATTYMTALAKKGIRLNQYYAQPSCTPSRSCIMSGKWVHKTGMQDLEVWTNNPNGVPLSNKLLSARMRDLGYRVYGFGKWNIGHCSLNYLPHERGFHSFLGYFTAGHTYKSWKVHYQVNGTFHWNEVRDMMSMTNEGEGESSWKFPKGEIQTYDTELFTNTSLDLIDTHFTDYAVKPMFMWLAHHGMHADSEEEPPSWMLTDANQEYLEELQALVDESTSADDPLFFSQVK